MTESFGVDHTHTARAVFYWAKSLYATGERTRSTSDMNRVSVIFSRAFGEEHRMARQAQEILRTWTDTSMSQAKSGNRDGRARSRSPRGGNERA